VNSTGEPPSSGYGNIYTPHAGSMIIQIQREGGLQNRTIVLSPRQVQVLGFVTSRTGKIVAALAAIIVLALAIEAIRIPFMSARLSRLQHTASRLDTLEHSLSELQLRYDQVERMLGAKPAEGLTPAPPAITKAGDQAGSNPSAAGGVPESRGKSSVPMD
jgi:hypothetical protein